MSIKAARSAPLGTAALVLRAIDLPEVRSAAEHGAAGQLPDVVAIGALT
jgi:hypothetical protein